ncbi:MAG: regulatory protein RecX [Candidatus Doudnabacteria bacterium]|nr:regulatory protein RecX [Candidatus Doudnabacteria bacterium]
MWSKPAKAKDGNSYDDAYKYAVRLLELQLRSEGELRAKMKQKTYTEAVINQVLESLTKAGFVNDERLIESTIRNFKEYKPYGFSQVKVKLIQRQFPKSLIEQALADFFTPEDEFVVARRLLEKLQGRVRGDTEQAIKQKLIQRLRSHGFRSQVLFKAFKGEVWDE